METVLAVIAIGLAGLAGLPLVGAGAVYLWRQPWASPARKRPPDPGTEPTVSIVLPTFNEEEIIERKLEELCTLEYPADRLEVVVVDDSEDETAEVVRGFFAERDQPSLTLLDREGRRGVATGINEAVAAATGEIIFRTDADSVIDETAVTTGVANLADERIGAVTGRQSSVIGESAVESEYRDALAKVQALESSIDSTFIMHGPCTAIRRDAFHPIDPTSLADDTEIGVRARLNGHRVVMDPEMEFAESGVSGIRARRRRKDRRAMGLIKVLVQHRDALGKFGLYGRLILPFNWWVLIVSPWLLLVALILGTAAATLAYGLLGLAVPGLMAMLAVAGSRDALGPAQPVWTYLDAQVSLLIAGVRLTVTDPTGTWAVDRESREAFETGET